MIEYMDDPSRIWRSYIAMAAVIERDVWRRLGRHRDIECIDPLERYL